MATTFTSLIAQSRIPLLEPVASFWADTELLAYLIDGARDLWRAVLDLHQEHFLTVDVTNVSLAANGTSLTGTPADVFRVHTIEVRDLTTSNTIQNCIFEAKDFNHADFVAARGMSAQDANGLTIYFCLIGAGGPVAAPTIRVAPKLTAALNLTLGYIPTLGTIVTGDNNPIPGESDHALIAWAVAHAKAKERPDGTPDPEWLSIYATDKKNLLAALTPRQEQDEEYAQALFEEYW